MPLLNSVYSTLAIELLLFFLCYCSVSKPILKRFVLKKVFLCYWYCGRSHTVHTKESVHTIVLLWLFMSDRRSRWSFDVFFDLRVNERLSKQSRGWWFETPSRSLWRQCNDIDQYQTTIKRNNAKFKYDSGKVLYVCMDAFRIRNKAFLYAFFFLQKTNIYFLKCLFIIWFCFQVLYTICSIHR